VTDIVSRGWKLSVDRYQALACFENSLLSHSLNNALKTHN
jgi:hypothetical protein